jgi:hypothetical protein
MAELLGQALPAKLLNPFIIRMGSRTEKVRALLMREKPRFSTESLSVSLSHSAYSNKKISERLAYSFIPVKESVQSSLRQHLKIQS